MASKENIKEYVILSISVILEGVVAFTNIKMRPFFSGRIDLSRAQLLDPLPRPTVVERVEEIRVDMLKKLQDYEYPICAMVHAPDMEEAETAFAEEQPFKVVILVLFSTLRPIYLSLFN